MSDKTITRRPSPLLSLVVNFIIPIIILTRFSAESQLGPIKAMLLALAFPVAYELYNIVRNRKISALSVISIGGILVTGAISLLGLSESWLAVRRSAVYGIAALVLLGVMLVRPLFFEKLLGKLVDMDRINAAAGSKESRAALHRAIIRTGYLLCILFAIIAVAAYISTRVVIDSPTDTAAFNTEYARLRVLSIPYLTVPLMVGFIGILMYLLARIEKLTGLEADALLRKKQP